MSEEYTQAPSIGEAHPVLGLAYVLSKFRPCSFVSYQGGTQVTGSSIFISHDIITKAFNEIKTNNSLKAQMCDSDLWHDINDVYEHTYGQDILTSCKVVDISIKLVYHTDSKISNMNMLRIHDALRNS